MSADCITQLDALAQAINCEVDAAESAARSAVEHARRAGELLLEAKAALAHGEWTPWLEGNCTVSTRTARAYMQLARGMVELPEGERQRVANLPLRGALKELAAPKSRDPIEELWDYARDLMERRKAFEEHCEAIAAAAEAETDIGTVYNYHLEVRALEGKARGLDVELAVLREQLDRLCRMANAKIRELRKKYDRGT